MRSHPPDQARLLPEGRRWGFGAHSVVPYLSHTPHAAPGAQPQDADAAIRNPVFPEMDKALRALRPRH